MRQAAKSVPGRLAHSSLGGLGAAGIDIREALGKQAIVKMALEAQQITQGVLIKVGGQDGGVGARREPAANGPLEHLAMILGVQGRSAAQTKLALEAVHVEIHALAQD